MKIGHDESMATALERVHTMASLVRRSEQCADTKFLDPASLGYASLRLIQKVMGQIGIGTTGLSRVLSDELTKVAQQMTLIAISTCGREVGPAAIRRLRLCHHILETPQAKKQLRRNSDVPQHQSIKLTR